MSSDTFLTIIEPWRVEIPKIKGSRFIGDAVPVSTVSRAEKAVEAAREREPNATHHCWGYRLGREGATYRYSDDGEPGGTAGQPILRQIDGRNLTALVVIVTRYFGGTKLGTGGLVHAYGEAAGAVLDAATVAEKVLREPVHISFSYDDTSAVTQVLHKFDVEVTASNYTDVTQLVVQVRKLQADAFKEALTNALSGRGEIRSTAEE